ncbi:MAG TPA: hypothetical protein VJ866_11145 [Pyrinomonadaceae bacterium]|nr:hypothetical protein [Pyrinomonadaceae bacterium]
MMRRLTLPRRALFVAALIAVTGALIISVSLRRTAAVRYEQAVAKQKFLASVRDGVGSEVSFARRGDTSNGVRASVESAAHFMRQRSGVDLRGQTKTRLADMEARALNGTLRRITPDELSEAISATAVERVAASSDEEIGRAAETLRGFNAPDLPDSFRNARAHVQLRANSASDITPEQLAAQVKAARDADPVTRALIKAGVKRAASEEVQKRTKYLGEAIPEQFGSAAAEGFTPLQAVLIAYSAASDDPLADSAANLQKRLASVHDGIERVTGRHYPGPDGHLAYGPNGYIFSTPLDIIFDEQTVNLLLDHIEGRSVSQ